MIVTVCWCLDKKFLSLYALKGGVTGETFLPYTPQRRKDFDSHGSMEIIFVLPGKE